MSGPKSLSCAMFNEKLNQIFKLQSQIESLSKFLKKAGVLDKERQIRFNCESFNKKNIDAEQSLLKTYLSDYKGTKKESIKIEKTIGALKNHIKKQKKEKTNFLNKNEDYNDFLQYEKFYNNSLSFIENYKLGVIEFLKSILKGQYSDLLNEAVVEITGFSLPINATKFSIGFRKNLQAEKNKLSDMMLHTEKRINKVRTRLIDKIIKLQDVNGENFIANLDTSKLLYKKQNNKDVKEILNEINDLLCKMEDSPIREIFYSRLKKLMNSETFIDPYFYTEILEEIRSNDKILKWKAELKEGLVKLNEIEIAAELENKKNKLVSDLIKIINEDVIKKHEVEDLDDKINELLEEDRKKLNELALKKRQRQFLKQELVKGLENLNYNVVDDMQVVDFEKEDDFILKIPNQNNYLNLRFDENKTDLTYNFLIPEDREKLSVDEVKSKLNNMETACSDFKSVLKSLSNYGMKFNFEKEIQISDKAILQLPEKIRKKLTQSKKRNVKTTIKKMTK